MTPTVPAAARLPWHKVLTRQGSIRGKHLYRRAGDVPARLMPRVLGDAGLLKPPPPSPLVVSRPSRRSEVSSDWRVGEQ